MNQHDMGGESRFFSAPDGLRIHAKDWGPREAGACVVCLPGLARTAGDFDRLAARLSSGPEGRRVIALDYRGRGLSERDPSGQYDIMVENADILSVLTAMEAHEAVFIGTSRGGLHAMIVGAMRPAMIRGVVMNDVGPRIETAGLLRIRSYVGKMPTPRSMEEAVEIVKAMGRTQFTDLPEEEWRAFAELTFEEKNGAITPRYDPRLTSTLETLDLDKPMPEFWPQFEGLFHAPLLALRGENSDLLSPATFEAMLARHPDSEGLTVRAQGHAPLLRDADTMEAIARFVGRCLDAPPASGG